MPLIPINIGPISGDTATAVTVTALVRGDNGAIPSGVSLPLSLVLSNSVWSATFNDSSPPAFYLVTYTVTWSDASVTGPYQETITGSTGNVTGYFTNQTLINRFIGSILAGQLSNVDNAISGMDPTGVQDAISHAENFVNYELALFYYPTGASTPAFPITSFAYPLLQDCATMLACWWLYAKRGIEDDNEGIGGKFQLIQQSAKAKLAEIIRNGIFDVQRDITMNPSVVMSPVTTPFGQKNPIHTTANQIPQYP